MNNYATEFTYKVIDDTIVTAYGCTNEPLVIARIAARVIGLHDYKREIVIYSPYYNVVKDIMVNGKLVPTMMFTHLAIRMLSDITFLPAANNLATWMESLSKTDHVTTALVYADTPLVIRMTNLIGKRSMCDYDGDTNNRHTMPKNNCVLTDMMGNELKLPLAQTKMD